MLARSRRVILQKRRVSLANADQFLNLNREISHEEVYKMDAYLFGIVV